MIPEPPDGTKLVVSYHGSSELDFVVMRVDQAARMLMGVSADEETPENRWFVPTENGQRRRYRWDELPSVGTLHLIGPELGNEV